ncbi:MAG: c-type cytochrome [Acidiferrobacterales bacterium]
MFVKKLIFHAGVIFAAMHSPLIATGIAAGIAADAMSANEISAGQAIFDRLCVNCHRTPALIKTPTPELQSRLSSGAIQQHRFQLSDDELVQVIEYIKSVRP